MPPCTGAWDNDVETVKSIYDKKANENILLMLSNDAIVVNMINIKI